VQIALGWQRSRGPLETDPAQPGVRVPQGNICLVSREAPAQRACPRASGNSHLEAVGSWQPATRAIAEMAATQPAGKRALLPSKGGL